MASKTANYGLNKHSPQDFYNVEARNENWDKIDEALAATDPTKITAKAKPADGDGVMLADSADGGKAKRLLWSNVKAALGKLFVPLARKVNGKTLAKDVTLTGDDIAMGADDAESLRAAMAKRLMANGNVMRQGLIGSTLDDEYFASVAGTRDGGFFECYKDYTQRTQLVISSPNDTSLSVRIAQTADGTHWTSKNLATCETPEVHSLPLNIAGDINTSHYSRDQFGRVFVSIRVRPNTHWSEMKTIGTMPEGFRPDWDIVVPALVQSYGNPFHAEQLCITSTGAIITQGDYADVDQIFAQLTYPVVT